MTLFYLEFVNIGSLFLFSIFLVWTILFFFIRLSTYNLYSEKLSARNVFYVRFYLVAILFIIKSSFKINKYYFCDGDNERGIFSNVNLPLSIDGGFLFLGLGGSILAIFLSFTVVKNQNRIMRMRIQILLILKEVFLVL
jgi:hypothetical protein